MRHSSRCGLGIEISPSLELPLREGCSGGAAVEGGALRSVIGTFPGFPRDRNWPGSKQRRVSAARESIGFSFISRFSPPQ